jgi:hypothetical protein
MICKQLHENDMITTIKACNIDEQEDALCGLI